MFASRLTSLCLVVCVTLALGSSFASASLLLGWGENHLGALGAGDREGWVLTPTRLAALPGRNITALTASRAGVTVALDDGSLWTTGHVFLNPQGEVADVLDGPAATLGGLRLRLAPSGFPPSLFASAPITQLASKNCSTFALLNNGSLVWWRAPESAFGEAQMKCSQPENFAAPSTQPTLFALDQLPPTERAINSISCNAFSSVCAILTSQGTAYTFGSNPLLSGNASIAPPVSTYVPMLTHVAITNSTSIISDIQIGETIACLLTTIGECYCWGDAYTTSDPQLVLNQTTITKFVTLKRRAIFLRHENGTNNFLFDSDSVYSLPTELNGTIVSLAGSANTLHILYEDGNVYSWDNPFEPPDMTTTGRVDAYNSDAGFSSPNYADALPAGYRTTRIFASASAFAAFIVTEPRTGPEDALLSAELANSPPGAPLLVSWSSSSASSFVSGVGVSKLAISLPSKPLKFCYNSSTRITSFSGAEYHGALTTDNGDLYAWGDASYAHWIPNARAIDAPVRVEHISGARNVHTSLYLTIWQNFQGDLFWYGLIPFKRDDSSFRDDNSDKKVEKRDTGPTPLGFEPWSLAPFTTYEILFAGQPARTQNITDIQSLESNIYLKIGDDFWQVIPSASPNASIIYNATAQYGAAKVYKWLAIDFVAVFADPTTPGGTELRIITLGGGTQLCANNAVECQAANSTAQSPLNSSSIIQIESGPSGLFIYLLTDLNQIWFIGTDYSMTPIPGYHTTPLHLPGLDYPGNEKIVKIAVQGTAGYALTSGGQLWAWGDEYLTGYNQANVISRVPGDWNYTDIKNMPGNSMSHLALVSDVKRTISVGDFNLAGPISHITYGWGDNSGGVLGLGRSSMDGLYGNSEIKTPTLYPADHLLNYFEGNITLLGVGHGSTSGETYQTIWGSRLDNPANQPAFMAPTSFEPATVNSSLWHPAGSQFVEIPYGSNTLMHNFVLPTPPIPPSKRDDQRLRREVPPADPDVMSPWFSRVILQNPYALSMPNFTNCAATFDNPAVYLTCSSPTPYDPFFPLSEEELVVVVVSCLLRLSNGELCSMGVNAMLDVSTGLYGPPSECQRMPVYYSTEPTAVFYSTGWNVIPQSTPASALYGHTVEKWSMGFEHAVGLTNNGTIISFGSNLYGQQGPSFPSVGQPGVPIEIPTPGYNGTRWLKVIAGGYSSYAVAADSNLILAWGNNDYGQLGSLSIVVDRDSAAAFVAAPSPVSLPTTTSHIVDFACSSFNCYLIFGDGGIYTWGAAQFGLLARPITGKFDATPVLIPALHYPLPNWIPSQIITSPTAHSVIVRATQGQAEVPCVTAAPAAVFQCTQGVWVYYGNLNIGGPNPGDPATLVIGSPVTIYGDLNVVSGGSIVFTGVNGASPDTPLLNVTGCYSSPLPFEIQFNPSQWKQTKGSLDGHHQLLVESGACPGSATANLATVVKAPKDCHKATGKTKTSDLGGGRTGYTVIFNISSTCNIWWIVLLSVIGGVLIITAILAIVYRRRLSKAMLGTSLRPKGL